MYILIIDLMVINGDKWCKWLTGEKIVNTELHNSQTKDKFQDSNLNILEFM